MVHSKQNNLRVLSAILFTISLVLTLGSQIYCQQKRLTVSTDKSTYYVGDLIKITVKLTDENGNPIPNVVIGIEVWNPKGTVVYSDQGSTNSQGEVTFGVKAWPPSNWPLGTYTVHVAGGGLEASTTFKIVEKPPAKKKSSISIKVNKQVVAINETIVIEGNLSPGLEGSVITIEIKSASENVWNVLAKVATQSNGYFKYSFKLSKTGTYYIRAKWSGNEQYEGCTSNTIKIEVKGLMSQISINIPKELTLYSSLTVKGILKPILTTKIKVTVTNPDNKTRTFEVNVVNGEFSFRLTFTIPGYWYIKLYWPGSESITPCEKVVKVLVYTSTSITLDVYPKVIEIDKTIVIDGSIIPPPKKGVVVVEYSFDNKTWFILANVSVKNGNFRGAYIVHTTGVFYLRAKWIGNEAYKSSVSNVVKIIVTKKISKLKIKVVPTYTYEGEKVTIRGNVIPPLQGITITLYYKGINEKEWHKISDVTTDVNGAFAITWIPPGSGAYLVMATWSGNNIYNGSRAIASLTVAKIVKQVTIQNKKLNIVSNATSVKVQVRKEYRRIIEINVTGPSGEKGYITFELPVSLLKSMNATIHDITVFIDNKPVNFTYRLIDEKYIIYIEMKFSTHIVEVVIGKADVYLTFLDPYNKALGNVLVKFYKNDTLLAEEVTKPNGKIHVKLPYGKYSIVAYYRGVNVYKLFLRVNETLRQQIKLELHTVKVKIITQLFGKPVSNIIIGVKFPDGSMTFAITDEKGEAVLKNLPRGQYNLIISGVGTMKISVPQITELVVKKFDPTEYMTIIVIVFVIIIVTSIVAITLYYRRKLKAKV